MKVTDKQIDRYIKAINTFGTSGARHLQEKQLARDLKFMDKKYDEGGRWSEGKKHACKELFKRIFKPEIKKP